MKVAGSDLDVSGVTYCPAIEKEASVNLTVQKIHSNAEVSGTIKSCNNRLICEKIETSNCLLKKDAKIKVDGWEKSKK